MARGRPRKDQEARPIDGGADAPQETSNSAARADVIRAAVRFIADMNAEIKALREELNEYKQKHIKGDLGFKLADFNAIYRVSQLEVEDRDKLLDTIKEGFAALGIGQSVDWVAAAVATPPPSAGNGKVVDPNPVAHQTGFADGVAGNVDHAARWPKGEPGHADYHLGHREGEEQRERASAL